MNEIYKIIVSIAEKNMHKIMARGLEIQRAHPHVHLEARLDSAKELSDFNNRSKCSLKSLLMMFPNSHLVMTNYPKNEVKDTKRFGYEGPEEKRREILEYCVNYFSSVKGVNYITAELDGFRKFDRDPNRALIILAKHFNGENYDSQAIERAIGEMRGVIEQKEADIAKVAAFTKTREEVEDFRRITRKYSKEFPLIAVPMGGEDFVKEARIKSLYEDKVFATFAREGSGVVAGQPSVNEILTGIRK